MASVKMNTEKLKSLGEDLKEIAKDYNNAINDVYSILNNIPKSGAWIGDKPNSSVNIFINVVSRDKSSMLALANSMNSLGKSIIDYADSIALISDNKI